METVSTGARQEIVGALRQRYEQASKWEKGRILTEFASVSGYHRKYAIRLLNLRGQTKMRSAVKSQRLYDEAVKAVLLTVWETADRICGKRLKAVIPNLVGAMENTGT